MPLAECLPPPSPYEGDHVLGPLWQDIKDDGRGAFFEVRWPCKLAHIDWRSRSFPRKCDSRETFISCAERIQRLCLARSLIWTKAREVRRCTDAMKMVQDINCVHVYDLCATRHKCVCAFPNLCAISF